MIKELKISNYFSIKHEQKLDLSVAGNAPQRDGYFVAHQDVPKLVLPRVVVFFGANASGKTTVLRALTFLSHFVRSSFLYSPDGAIPLFPFGNNEAQREQIKLSISFLATLSVGARANHPVLFKYALAVAPDGKTVAHESLTYAPMQRTRLLFQRDGEVVRTGDDFELPATDPSIAKIRSNASLISSLAQFNHPFATALYQAASRFISNVAHFGIVDLPAEQLQQVYRTDASLLEAVNRDVRKIDLGIEEIGFAGESNGAPMVFRHRGLDSLIPFGFQSHGTRKFLGLYPRIHQALAMGAVCVLDEIDSDIHPTLLPEIIGWFRSPERNPNFAQLFAACQNPSLLDHLAKEEIWFAEKDDVGRTSVYGMKEIKGVRRDVNVRARYLQGAFGAVPRLA